MAFLLIVFFFFSSHMYTKHEKSCQMSQLASPVDTVQSDKQMEESEARSIQDSALSLVWFTRGDNRGAQMPALQLLPRAAAPLCVLHFVQ